MNPDFCDPKSTQAGCQFARNNDSLRGGFRVQILTPLDLCVSSRMLSANSCAPTRRRSAMFSRRWMGPICVAWLMARALQRSRLFPQCSKTLSHEDDATAEPVRRVARLIEGFETRYGMELLAMTHWVDGRAQGSLDRRDRRARPCLECGRRAPGPFREIAIWNGSMRWNVVAFHQSQRLGKISRYATLARATIDVANHLLLFYRSKSAIKNYGAARSKKRKFIPACVSTALRPLFLSEPGAKVYADAFSFYGVRHRFACAVFRPSSQ
jgi:hypothetical protein